jgi:2,4'-dihydroxyacetophenone dioxygenase
MTAELTAHKVPVLSLPQTELLTVNVNEIPVLKDSLGPGIDFQPLFLDPELGAWVIIGTFAPVWSCPSTSTPVRCTVTP